MGRRSRDELNAIVERVPLFAHLPKAQRRALARLATEEKYAAGAEILKQREEAQHMAVLISGTANVVRDGKTIASVGPGDVVGEMSLIDGERRSAAVAAETEVEAVVIYRSAFLKLLEENPAISMKLMAALTARLREADKKLATLG